MTERTGLREKGGDCRRMGENAFPRDARGWRGGAKGRRASRHLREEGRAASTTAAVARAAAGENVAVELIEGRIREAAAEPKEQGRKRRGIACLQPRTIPHCVCQNGKVRSCPSAPAVDLRNAREPGAVVGSVPVQRESSGLVPELARIGSDALTQALVGRDAVDRDVHSSSRS